MLKAKCIVHEYSVKLNVRQHLVFLYTNMMDILYVKL